MKYITSFLKYVLWSRYKQLNMNAVLPYAGGVHKVLTLVERFNPIKHDLFALIFSLKW